MSGIGSIGSGGIGSGGGVQQILALRQQIVDRSELLRQIHAPPPPADPVAAGTPTGGFGDALKHALDSVSDAQQRAQSLSEGYERGEVTDIAAVMLARQESGLAFEATLQVRNRLLSAYQDIMRMGV